MEVSVNIDILFLDATEGDCILYFLTTYNHDCHGRHMQYTIHQDFPPSIHVPKYPCCCCLAGHLWRCCFPLWRILR